MRSPSDRIGVIVRCAAIAAILLVGLQAFSADAAGMHDSVLNDPVAQQAGCHHAQDESLCTYAASGKDSAPHCHTLTAAARMMVSGWSPESRDAVSDDGVVVALPRRAMSILAVPRALPAGPPAFILFANFRS